MNDRELHVPRYRGMTVGTMSLCVLEEDHDRVVALLQAELTKARELMARIMGKRDACMSSYWFDEIDVFLARQSAPAAKEN